MHARTSGVCHFVRQDDAACLTLVRRGGLIMIDNVLWCSLRKRECICYGRINTRMTLLGKCLRGNSWGWLRKGNCFDVTTRDMLERICSQCTQA